MPSPFIAQHAREVIEAGGALPTPLAVAWPNAVVAIIDVSGYTKLTNTMMEQEGSAGAAYVKEVLNPPLVLLVQTVHQAGGTVVKFAGDAVIACFGRNDDPSDGRLPLLRSMLCSLQLLTSFADLAHSTSPAAVLTGSAAAAAQALNIHVGVGAGAVQHIHLGETMLDPEEPVKLRREYFIAGDALLRAGDMLGHAKAGEIAIPADTVDRVEPLKRYLAGMVVGDHAVVSADNHKAMILNLIEALQVELIADDVIIDGGCEGTLEERADPTGDLKDVVLSYVEESLAAAIRTSAGAHGALRGTYDQIRRVTIVFVKLAGLDVGRLAEHPHLGRAQRCLLDILLAIRPYGGCLRQFCCDDKSTTALCVFGMAGFAHERGEERHALDAALKILGTLEPGVQPSIGMATGPVFAGVVGDAHRSDGTVLGVCVNLAARIMSSDAAKGAVVCDSETWTAVGEGAVGLKFTSLPEATPYYAYSEILKCIVDSLQRRGVTAKSISERMPRDMGGTIVEWSSSLIGPAASRQSIGINIRGSVGFGGESTADSLAINLSSMETPAQLFASLGEPMKLIKTIYRFIPMLGKGHFADDSETSALKSDVQAGINAMIIRTLKALTNHLDEKVVIILDDMQWMDSITLELTHRHAFAPHKNDLMLNKELKPSVKKSLEDISSLSGVLHLQLSALTLEDIIKIAHHILGEKLKTPELVVDVSKKVFDLAQGNPMAATMMCNILKSGEDLEVLGRGTMNPILQDFLEVAAIAGMQFNLEETAAITRDVKGGSWNASYARELIRSYDDFNFIQFVRGSNRECFFTHNFMRQGILTTILPAMAESIHLALANSIEASMVAEEDSSRLTPLIYHLLRVSDPSLQERKYRHVYKAFAASASIFRHVEGLEFYEILQTVNKGIKQTPVEIVNENSMLAILYLQTEQFPLVIEVCIRGFAAVGFEFPAFMISKWRNITACAKWFLAFMRMIKMTKANRHVAVDILLRKLFPKAFLATLDVTKACFQDITDMFGYMLTSAAQSKAPGLDAMLIVLLECFLGFFVESDQPYRVTAMAYQVAFGATMGGLVKSSETICRIANMDLTPLSSDILFHRDYTFATANKAIMAALYCDFEQCYLHQQWCWASIVARSVELVLLARRIRYDIMSTCLVLGKFSDMEKEALCAVEQLKALDEKDKDIRYFSGVTMLVAVFRGDAQHALKLYQQWLMDDSLVEEVRRGRTRSDSEGCGEHDYDMVPRTDG
ncbi:Adenylate cyclase type 10 [Irineochytrium annulatum]|nr:Adenylate cyclase type 10 [Irineochytrium annulatum]